MATEHTSGKDMSGSASGHRHMHGHGHGHKSFKYVVFTISISLFLRGNVTGVNMGGFWRYCRRRKYRKLKLRFDAVMKQSDDLFAKDITATAQVKRITEENKYVCSHSYFNMPLL